MKLNRDLLRELLTYAGFLLCLYLFYKSWIVLLIFPVCVLVYRKISRKDRERRRKDKINSEFKEALLSMSAALRAGYSVENALIESLREMENMFGNDAGICRELRKMINKISLGVNAEDVFDEFAQEMQVEDIFTFASVFRIAKRSGGDMVEIIRRTAGDIASKVDTGNEISVMVSAKRLEQRIMMAMPLAMILYIDLTSGGLLAPLYGNALGVVIMTACLIVYAAAWLISKKIMDIKV